MCILRAVVYQGGECDKKWNYNKQGHLCKENTGSGVKRYYQKEHQLQLLKH